MKEARQAPSTAAMQPASKKRSAEEGGAAETEMAALERQAARIVEATSQKAPAADPNEIDLDDDDSDDDGEQVLSTKPVPAAVFGSAAAQAAEMSEPQGALARFQKKAS